MKYSFAIVLFCSFSSILYAASPGLPFTENFSNQNLVNSSKSTALWSPTEQAIYLQWADFLKENKVELHENSFHIPDENYATEIVELFDMNGDGHLDIVTLSQHGKFNIRLNTGNTIPFDDSSTFIELQIDTEFRNYFAVGDVNHDGSLDIITGGTQTEKLKLYLNNNSNIPFDISTSGIPIGNNSENAFHPTLCDFDDDGDMDIVVIIYDDVVVFHNNGTDIPFGEFDEGQLIDTITRGSLRDIEIGDMNNDGNLDIVISTIYASTSEIYLYLNTGNGISFNPSGVIETDTKIDDLNLGDMDGDGDLDLVSGHRHLFLNESDSNGIPFSSSITSTIIGTDPALDRSASGGLGANSALADMDGDGDLDLISGVYEHSSGYDRYDKLYLNDGDSDPFDSVTTGITIFVNRTATTDVAIGDLNSDGTMDVVAFGHGFEHSYVCLNYPENIQYYPIAPRTPLNTFADRTSSIALGDLNADGHLDVAVGNGHPFGDGLGYREANTFYLNDGINTSFIGYVIDTAINATHSIDIADMDGDETLDIVAGNGYDESSKLFLNDDELIPFQTVGAGKNFGPMTNHNISTTDIALGDLDGDGDIDVVKSNYGHKPKIYLNDGDDDPLDTSGGGLNIGTLDDKGIYVESSIIIADMNGDGDLDIIIGTIREPNKLFLNDGDANPFDSAGDGLDIGTDEDDTRAIVVGDIDNDGDLDVIAGNGLGNAFYLPRYGAVQSNKLYLNDGDLSPFDQLTTGIPIGAEKNPTSSLGLSDIDNDGYLDLVVGNDSGIRNRLYLNDSDNGHFSATSFGYHLGIESDNTLAIELGDLDNDGYTDVLTGNYEQTNNIYLNNQNTPPSDIPLNYAYDTGLGTIESLKINDTETNIARVILTTTDKANSQTLPNTNIAYYVSNNGGEQWQKIEPGIPFDFAHFGSDLRWKAILSSLSPTLSPSIESITLEEILLAPNPETASLLRKDFFNLDTGTNPILQPLFYTGDGQLSFEESGLDSLAELKAYDRDGNGLLSLLEILHVSLDSDTQPESVYVDFYHEGTQEGTQSNPFTSLLEGTTWVQDNGTVIIAPSTSGNAFIIDKALILQHDGSEGVVSLGTP